MWGFTRCSSSCESLLLSCANLQASAKEAAAALAAKRAEIAMAPEARVCLVLDMEFRDINRVPSDIFQRKIQAFKTHLIEDIVKAIDGHKDHIQIEKIEPGSIIVTIAIETGVCGDQQSPNEAARSLKEQAADPKSKLMNGLYTRKTKSVSILTDAVEVTVDPCHEGTLVRAESDTADSLPRAASNASGSGFSTSSAQAPQSGNPAPLTAPSLPKLPPRPMAADCDPVFAHGLLPPQPEAPNKPVFAHGLLPPQPEAPNKASHISAG